MQELIVVVCVWQADEVRDVPAGPGRPCEEVPARELGTFETRCVLLPQINSPVYLLVWCSVDIPVILPEDDTLLLDEYLGRGLQPGETELPKDEPGTSIAPGTPLPNINANLGLGQQQPQASRSSTKRR